MRIIEFVQEVIEAGLVVALEHQRQREPFVFAGDGRRNNGRLLQRGQHVAWEADRRRPASAERLVLALAEGSVPRRSEKSDRTNSPK